MKKIGVMIVDDQKLFAESLRTFIHNYADDIEVTGIASGGREALQMRPRLSPSLVLMDVHMPGLNGVEAARLLLNDDPSLKIIMLSIDDEDENVRQALSYGASGYLLKDLSPTELIACIRAVEGGVSQISPKVIKRLIQRLHDEDESAITVIEGLSTQLEWVEKLTKREKEIFTLIATGYDNDQIADELCISERTVRNHVSMIYSKLDIDNRFQIIQLANKIHYHL